MVYVLTGLAQRGSGDSAGQAHRCDVLIAVEASLDAG